MENKSLFENICRIFFYDSKNNKIEFSGRGEYNRYFLFNFLFLKENGQIEFNSVNELWLIKEFETEEKKKFELEYN